ncbi:hypothetical protein HMPREF9098_1776 [Kingella denitrificans ATCC 33394]|uniref:Uncharacterized protein n=1 Tax=Kingella denitrificans ATCC 33394 TaxID=888741 RepID=F0F0Z1_9NEIS|nr:hypothetical protein HMPREF9098_1776 [Kingella denitrificans ATCC 33394]
MPKSSLHFGKIRCRLLFCHCKTVLAEDMQAACTFGCQYTRPKWGFACKEMLRYDRFLLTLGDSK